MYVLVASNGYMHQTIAKLGNGNICEWIFHLYKRCVVKLKEQEINVLYCPDKKLDFYMLTADCWIIKKL